MERRNDQEGASRTYIIYWEDKQGGHHRRNSIHIRRMDKPDELPNVPRSSVTPKTPSPSPLMFQDTNIDEHGMVLDDALH